MFKGLLRSARAVSFRQPAFPRATVQVTGPLLNVKRCYAKSWDGNNSSPDVEAHLKVQKLLDDIQQHPGVAAKLHAVSEIMVSKGLANESAPPGPWQVVKILTDKDVRKAMGEFKAELEKSGIELGPDQLGPLMTVLGMEKK
ncbi:LAQU0S01e12662g1_1 [Lachancea quebecensis]|uniref:LAQU0S01e12662g1_1 n=1 Tax=Lachancea quebecensis TaxID=1654605 RepID=A0A0P1KXG8_9SACH|nr:LAQU0S01e12662g1_1 [Lachancea quebecensis]